MKEIFLFLIAVTICSSPLALVYKVAGKEGLVFFLWYIFGFIVVCSLYCLASWALTTVLGAAGFDKDKINKGGQTTINFWWK